MSAIHHLLPFRPFAGVHGAQKPTSSYRTGKLPVRKRPNTESWVRYVRADVLSLRLRNFGLPAISRYDPASPFARSVRWSALRYEAVLMLLVAPACWLWGRFYDPHDGNTNRGIVNRLAVPTRRIDTKNA